MSLAPPRNLLPVITIDERKAGFAVRSLRKQQEPQMQSYLKRRTHIKHFFERFRE